VISVRHQPRERSVAAGPDAGARHLGQRLTRLEPDTLRARFRRCLAPSRPRQAVDIRDNLVRGRGGAWRRSPARGL